MKRVFCLLLALLMLLPIGAQAFAEEAMFCRMCGKQIPADSKVCSFCGEKVVLLEQTTNVKTALNGDAGATVAADVKSAPLAASNGVTVTRISAPSPATAEAPVPGPFNSTVSTSGSLGKVRVTKSPTSESVPYGGSCIFIAHAVNATSVTWYISNGDGSMISTAAEAPSRVSGLSVSGANSDTLSLSGIPSWMNGCKVQACFSGEGGPVYSEIAYIWTYQNNQTNNKSWTWWDYVNCRNRRAAYLWEAYWCRNLNRCIDWLRPRPVDPPPKPVDPAQTAQAESVLWMMNDKGDVVKVEKPASDKSAWDKEQLAYFWKENFDDEETKSDTKVVTAAASPEKVESKETGTEVMVATYIEDIENNETTLADLPAEAEKNLGSGEMTATLKAEEPADTSEQQSSAAPESSYVEPESTYVAPESSYVEPESTYVAPESTYVAPESSYVEPESTYVAPESSYVAPESSYVAPEATYTVPESFTSSESGRENPAAEQMDGLMMMAWIDNLS